MSSWGRVEEGVGRDEMHWFGHFGDRRMKAEKESGRRGLGEDTAWSRETCELEREEWGGVNDRDGREESSARIIILTFLSLLFSLPLFSCSSPLLSFLSYHSFTLPLLSFLSSPCPFLWLPLFSPSISLPFCTSLSSSLHQLQCRDLSRGPRQAVRWPGRRLWHHRPLDWLSALRRCHGNVGNGLQNWGWRRDACRRRRRRRRGSRRMRKEYFLFSFFFCTS